MSNQPQWPFMIMPHFQPPPNQPYQDRVPRRIAVAMEILHMASQKTSTKYINENGVSQEATDKLDLEEKEALRASVDTLVAYMKGKLRPTVAEKAEMRQANERERSGGPRTIMRCPNCAGRSRVGPHKCDICQGLGFISAQPSNPVATDEVDS